MGITIMGCRADPAYRNFFASLFVELRSEGLAVVWREAADLRGSGIMRCGTVCQGEHCESIVMIMAGRELLPVLINASKGTTLVVVAGVPDRVFADRSENDCLIVKKGCPSGFSAHENAFLIRQGHLADRSEVRARRLFVSLMRTFVFSEEENAAAVQAALSKEHPPRRMTDTDADLPACG